jgi:hypothetical protein
MHKTAGALQVKDQFLMAGGHYEVVGLYPTVDDDMMKVAFCPVGSHIRNTMTLFRETMFHIL